MTLRAKSDGLTLVEHTAHVKASTLALVRLRGTEALQAFGLSSSLLRRLERVLDASAEIHGWGKATSCFQGQLEPHADVEQFLRHEMVSALLARRRGVAPEVLATVLGHHRKFHRGFW